MKVEQSLSLVLETSRKVAVIVALVFAALWAYNDMQNKKATAMLKTQSQVIQNTVEKLKALNDAKVNEIIGISVPAKK